MPVATNLFTLPGTTRPYPQSPSMGLVTVSTGELNDPGHHPEKEVTEKQIVT